MAVGKLTPPSSTVPAPTEVASPAASAPSPRPAPSRSARDPGAARALVAGGTAQSPLTRGLAAPALTAAMQEAQVAPSADPAQPGMVGHVDGDPLARALAELEARRVAAKSGAAASAAPIFATTKGPVSAYLRSVRLNESFDWGFPSKDSATNEVYVVTMAWDLSGREPVVFPPVKVDPSSMTRDMKKGQQLTFMGDGLALWPGTQVKGGLYTMVFVMESDSSVRQLGDTIQKVNDAVLKSDLAKALAALAVAEPNAAAIAKAMAAISAISTVVGTALQQNKDDLVGSFYGTYGVDSLTSHAEHLDSPGASIDVRVVAPAPPRTTPPGGGTKRFD